MDKIIEKLEKLYDVALEKGDIHLAFDVAVTMHQMQNHLGSYRLSETVRPERPFPPENVNY